MCILFLLVGDQENPTLICSNRDEYFDRPTQRGVLDKATSSYSPKDLDGGGTWLCADGLGGKKEFRFAVVLNLHHWRELYPFTSRASVLSKRRILQPPLLSRGLLAKDFIGRTDISALEYARHIFNIRGRYRPFNLVVSDRTGTYYVSCSIQQTDIERLRPGRVYAIANGYLHDAWDKASVGKYLIESALVDDLKVCTRVTASPTDADSVPIITTNLNAATAMRTARKLAEVMQTRTPLPDPTFGRRSTPAMYLSSIFARPTIIARRPVYKAAYIAQQFIWEILALLMGVLRWLMKIVFRLGERNSAKSASTVSITQRLRQWVHSVAVLAHYQPAAYVPLRNGSQYLIPDADMFGTRTITIIAHLPSSAARKGDSHNDGPATAAAAAADMSAMPDTSSAAVPAPVDPTVQDKTPTPTQASYFILERDLDTQRMTWSDAEYSNIH